MIDEEIEADVESRGIVSLKVHDVEELRENHENWDELSKEGKYEILQSEKPNQEIEESNVTTTGLHELIVDLMDESQSRNDAMEYLALGDDNTAPSSSDTSLNNEIYRGEVTSYSDSGASVKTSTFFDGTEANGYTLVECGLTTGPKSGTWDLLNHATFNSISKDSTKTLTIDVTVTFS